MGHEVVAVQAVLDRLNAPPVLDEDTWSDDEDGDGAGDEASLRRTDAADVEIEAPLVGMSDLVRTRM